MARNKPRLQLALYARPKHPGTYHYAIFIAPKINLEARQKTKVKPPVPVTKLHVKNTWLQVGDTVEAPWRFEREDVADIAADPRLLVVVTVGKIASGWDADKIERFLVDKIPIVQEEERDEGSDFNCVSWVRDAVKALARDGLVTGVPVGAWDRTRARAVQFVETKRLEGRWEVGWRGEEGVPTLDLLIGRETVT